MPGVGSRLAASRNGKRGGANPSSCHAGSRRPVLTFHTISGLIEGLLRLALRHMCSLQPVVPVNLAFCNRSSNEKILTKKNPNASWDVKAWRRPNSIGQAGDFAQQESVTDPNRCTELIVAAWRKEVTAGKAVCRM